jgi:hypothetical protein
MQNVTVVLQSVVGEEDATRLRPRNIYIKKAIPVPARLSRNFDFSLHRKSSTPFLRTYYHI